jgi:hypothetical protein
MADVLLIALAILFFVAAELFVRGCVRVAERRSADRTEGRP